MTLLVPRDTSGAWAVHAVRLLFHLFMKLPALFQQRKANNCLQNYSKTNKNQLKMEIITHRRKIARVVSCFYDTAGRRKKYHYIQTIEISSTRWGTRCCTGVAPVLYPFSWHWISLLIPGVIKQHQSTNLCPLPVTPSPPPACLSIPTSVPSSSPFPFLHALSLLPSPSTPFQETGTCYAQHVSTLPLWTHASQT